MNIDLVRRTLAAIESHPDEWYQQTWRCDSGMCFAGWAATLAGAQWLTDLDNATARAYVRYDGDQIPHDRWFTEIKRARHVRDYARYVLGVTDRQAEALFAGNNDLPTLQALVAALQADPEVDLFRVRIPHPLNDDPDD